MIHTDGIPTIANAGSDALLARQSVDPAATAECDGYPGLIAKVKAAGLGGGCCGDPGDCNECGS